MGVLDWSLSAARNALVDPLVRALDGASARDYPGMVRGVMAGMRALSDDQGGAIRTGGAANAYTARTSSGVAELRPGLRLLLCIDRDSTGAASLNADGTGPKPWLSGAGIELAPGALRKGRFVAATYDADLDAWRSDAGAAVSNVDLSAAPAFTLKGNAGAGTATPADLTVGQSRSLLGVDQVSNTSDAAKVQPGNPIGDALATKATPADIGAATAPLATNIAALQLAQAQGALSFPSLAVLNASLAYPEGALAQVVADGSNNGTYRKSGAANAGAWTFLTAATLPGLDARQTEDGARIDQADDVLADASSVVTAPRYGYAYTGPLSAVCAPADPSVLHCYPVMGQSNAEGATTGALLSTTAMYGGRTLMPDTGQHPDFGMTGFAALIEGADRIAYETIGSSFLNHLIRDLDGQIAGNAIGFATFSAAIGAQNYAQLKRGSLAWRRYTETLKGTCIAAGRRGQTLIVPGVIWNQGESAVGDFTGNRYARNLDQLQRQVQADTQRITGQCEPVILYVIQTAFIWATQSPVLGQVLQDAQLEAAARNPLIRIVGPQYQFEINGADGIHKTSAGANEMGQMVARAVLAEEYGIGWSPLGPREAHLTVHPDQQLRRIIVHCDVPVEPLVLDTSDAIIGLTGGSAGAPNFGFDAWGPGSLSLPIQSVSILSATTTATTLPTIAVDLVSAPAVPWVRLNYAMRRNSEAVGPGTYDGPRQGARGPFRDSANHVSLYGRPNQNNWMVHWSRRVLCNAAPSGGTV